MKKLRKEILEAVKKAVEDKEESDSYSSNNNQVQGELILSEAQKQTVYEVIERGKSLISCLTNSPLVKKVYFGAGNSLTVVWGETLKLSITIELSLFGRLAAVFPYGAPPEELLTAIENCLISTSLIKLSEKEIVELQEQDKYYLIFVIIQSNQKARGFAGKCGNW